MFSYVFKEDPQKLFSRPQRSYIADEMLQSVVYGDEGKAQVGLTRLLQENVFQAAFPLHDVCLFLDQKKCQQARKNLVTLCGQKRFCASCVRIERRSRDANVEIVSAKEVVHG